MFDRRCILSILVLLLVKNEVVKLNLLDDYVHAQDPHFGWTLLNTYHEQEYTLYILNFTSQKWLDGSFHWIFS